MKTVRYSNNQYWQKTALFFAVLFLCCNSIFSQKKEIDTSNIVSYPDKIMIRANLDTQSDAQSFEDKKGDNLYLETNYNYKLFFAVDYKFIGFSYGFQPAYEDADKKGKSKFSEYNFRFFTGKWLQTLEYSKIRGYYVANTQDFVSDWDPEKDPYLLFPNLKTIRYGMSTSYIFNPKFSLKSITSFTEWQKESAGSFIPTLLYDYKKTFFETDLLKSKQNDYDVSLGVGYFYNFIIGRRFYIAPNLTTAFGVKFTDSKIDNSGNRSEENNSYFLTTLKGGLRMGYNTERVLFGLNFNFDSTFYNQNQNQVVSDNKGYFLLYFGYRFDAPKFISKPVNKVSDKLKL